MNLLFNHKEAVARWVGQLNDKFFQEPYEAFGLVDNSGRLVGGFVFTGFNGNSIELSLAGPGVVYRGAWRAVIEYVFNQLACSRLEAHTQRANKRVRKMISRLGFKFEGVARKFYGNDDGLCYSLIRSDLPEFSRRWKL